MILLASDWVGLGISAYLATRGQPIDWLILDESDRGRCNAEIRRAIAGAAGLRRVESAASLSDPAFVQELAKTKPRLGVLAWWPHILKGPVIDVPQMGWINLHPGYLPYNRGKHPNFWCLVDGTPCGAALHFIDRGVDTGPVIARAQTETSWEDTGESIYRRCRDLAVQLFKDNFDAIVEGSAPPIPQGMADGTSHRGGEMDVASEIDLDASYPARRLLNLIRARMFPPHPTAFFRDGNRTYSVQVTIKEIRSDR